MVSSSNARCGIAEYTRFLLDHAGPAFSSTILANKDAEILDRTAEIDVTRCWTHRWNPDLDPLRRALDSSGTDVVHLQFNFGFFEVNHFAELLEHERANRGVVVTLHRTKDLEDETDGLISLKAIAPTLRRIDQVIVHQPQDADRLARMGVADNVIVVPHGTPRVPKATPAAVRDALGVGDRPIVGAFGFLLHTRAS